MSKKEKAKLWVFKVGQEVITGLVVYGLTLGIIFAAGKIYNQLVSNERTVFIDEAGNII